MGPSEGRQANTPRLQARESPSPSPPRWNHRYVVVIYWASWVAKHIAEIKTCLDLVWRTIHTGWPVIHGRVFLESCKNGLAQCWVTLEKLHFQFSVFLSPFPLPFSFSHYFFLNISHSFIFSVSLFLSFCA